MIAPHGYLAEEIEGRAKELVKLAQRVRENDELLAKLMEEDHVAALLDVRQQLARSEAELDQYTELYESEKIRANALVKKHRAFRVAINAKARNPLIDHAHAIFEALANALPNHPLVVREPTAAGERASLSRTDLRFIYACLDFAQNRMGNMSCNDWSIDNPSKADLWFMQRVENFTADDDGGHERRKIEPNEDGTAWGPANFLAPLYLMKLMEEVYSKETFEGATL